MSPPRPPGKILFLDGPSSSGKTTLARALQAALDEPYLHFSIDQFREVGALPRSRFDSREFLWADHREAFFEGFHRCLPALVLAGNNLIVEHIVETEAWRDTLLELLSGFDVLYVAIRCPLDELERREIARGDRRSGEARADFERGFLMPYYDVEVDSTKPIDDGVARVLAARKGR